MLAHILCCCDIPPAGPGPCYSNTILETLPSSYVPLLPPFISPGFAVGTVLAGTSITSSTEKATALPRPTIKTTAAKPGYSILNEQLENETRGSSNWPRGEV